MCTGLHRNHTGERASYHSGNHNYHHDNLSLLLYWCVPVRVQTYRQQLLHWQMSHPWNRASWNIADRSPISSLSSNLLESGSKTVVTTRSRQQPSRIPPVCIPIQNLPQYWNGTPACQQWHPACSRHQGIRNLVPLDMPAAVDTIDHTTPFYTCLRTGMTPVEPCLSDSLHIYLTGLRK